MRLAVFGSTGLAGAAVARMAIEYGLYGVPETFFIGRDGRVAYKHVGPVSAAILAHKIDSLLATAAPTPVPGS